MPPKKHIIYVNGERQEWDHDPLARGKPIELPVVTFGELKKQNATIRLFCRAFACWAVTDIPAREIDAPDDIRKLADLKFFGLKCPKCRCNFLMLSTL